LLRSANRFVRQQQRNEIMKQTTELVNPSFSSALAALSKHQLNYMLNYLISFSFSCAAEAGGEL
jgi:hypothetical protein